MFRVIPVRSLTGEPILPWLSVSGGSWKSSLSSPGEGSFTVELRDQAREYSPELVAALSNGWATTYVVEWVENVFQRRGTVMYAGLVTRDSFDDATGRMTVRTRELWTILTRRLVWGSNELSTVKTKTLTGREIRDMLIQMVRESVARNEGTRFGFPIDLPEQQSGLLTKKLFRHAFQTAQEVVDELMAEDGAPDAWLRPYWSGDRLRWQLEIGSPELDGGEVRVPVAAPDTPMKSAITGLTQGTDWSNVYSGASVAGKGSETDMRWAFYGVPNNYWSDDMPWMMTVGAQKHVSAESELTAIARAMVSGEPAQQWSYGLQLEERGRITPDMLRPGLRVLADHPGSERIPRGRYGQYVLEVSGDLASESKFGIESQGV